MATKYYTTENEPKSLGLTGATVGQIAKITAVDGTGKPTAWEAVDMAGGGVPQFQEVYSHTITAADLEVVQFTINSNDVPNIGEYNAFVLVLEFAENTPLTKWVAVTLNGARIAQLSGTSASSVRRYGAAFNRCFQKWCGTYVYKVDQVYSVAISAPYGADYVLDHNDDAQTIKWGSYSKDYGLAEGAVVRLYAAK